MFYILYSKSNPESDQKSKYLDMYNIRELIESSIIIQAESVEHAFDIRHGINEKLLIKMISCDETKSFTQCYIIFEDTEDMAIDAIIDDVKIVFDYPTTNDMAVFAYGSSIHKYIYRSTLMKRSSQS